MPFFLNKQTIHQFQTYLKTQTLDNLLELNHRYGDHFEQLFDQRDQIKIDLVKLKNDLSLQINTLELLLTTKPEIIESENRRLEALQSLDGSRTERFFQKNHLMSYSPLAQFNLSVEAQNASITKIQDLVKVTDISLNITQNDINLSIQELNIINKFIEREKNKQMSIGQPAPGLKN